MNRAWLIGRLTDARRFDQLAAAKLHAHRALWGAEPADKRDGGS